MISVILFDLDGVLVDACDWHYRSLNCALVEFGYSAINKEEHLLKYNGLPTHIKLEMLGVDERQAKQINKAKQEFTLEIIRKTAEIMPEKIELHKYLKQNGILIGCVTNSIRKTAEEMLFRTGQLEFMDILITNEDVLRNKPAPDCYNHAVNKLKKLPENCLCVEDSPKGILAAKLSVIPHLWIVDNTTNVTQDACRQQIERVL